MSEIKLSREIISMSVAQDWGQAKNEWKLQSITFARPPHVCLCGHYPIVELCSIQNKYNGNQATVGNCCVKKFMRLSSGKIFDAIKRVKADTTKSVNPDTIEIAYRQGWISLREYEFYKNIYKRRSRLSPKQIAWKIAINHKIMFCSGI